MYKELLGLTQSINLGRYREKYSTQPPGEVAW